MKFADKLKKLRTTSNMTQEELAEIILLRMWLWEPYLARL